MAKGKLVILTAPSGAGQDTIIKMFLAKHPDWWLSVSATTRPEVRPGEVSGKDMIFLSPTEFQTRLRAGDFLEAFQQMTGYWYGTLRAPVEEQLAKGINVIVRPEAEGAMAIKKIYPQAVMIFLNAESEEALEKRLRSRHTESETQIQQRLAQNRKKLAHISEYDHVVINPTGHPERAVAEIEKILAL